MIPPPQKGTSFKSTQGKEFYVPPLRQSNARQKPTANDWQLSWDEEYDPHVFPTQIATTNARPDLVIWSQSTRTCVVAELTVCWEENFHQAHERKEGKRDYVDLIRLGRQNGWTISYFPVEVGARGVLSDSLQAFLRFMGLSRRKATDASDSIGRTSLQASYTLWLSRDHKKFSRWTLVDRPYRPEKRPAKEQPAPGLQRQVDRSEVTGHTGRSSGPGTAPPRPPHDRPAPWAPAGGDCVREGEQFPTRRAQSTPRGLTNVGNTCFLNSISQCLLVTDNLTDSAPLGIRDALARLKSTRDQTTCPRELITVVTRLDPSITSGQQQDAAEALELMLASDTSRETHQGSHRGETADVISCSTCGHSSAQTTPFNPPILRVPITAPTLDRCLSDLFTPQPIEDRRCDLCHTAASKISIEFRTTPPAMVLQLLRFHQGTEVSKNTSRVTISPTIHLDGETWQVTGLVNHIGALNHGHYTACVHHQHKWFRCDDARVVEIPAGVVFSASAKSAYLVFLRKV